MLTGDFAALEQFRAKLASYPDKVRRITRIAGPRLRRTIYAAVKAGREADGTPFAPLRNRSGTPLATLSRPVQISVQPSSIVVTVLGKLQNIAHAGRKGGRAGLMLPRPLIPAEDAALPDAWLRNLEDAAEATLGEEFR